MEEKIKGKSCALTLLKVPVISVVTDLHISRQNIYDLKWAAARMVLPHLHKQVSRSKLKLVDDKKEDIIL